VGAYPFGGAHRQCGVISAVGIIVLIKNESLVKSLFVLLLSLFFSSTCVWGQEFKYDRKSDQWYFKDASGKKKKKQLFDSVDELNLNAWSVYLDGQCGLFYADKGLVTPLDYDSIQNTSGYFFKVFRDNRVGLISSRGELLIPTSFEDVDHYSKEGSLVKQEGTWLYWGPDGVQEEKRPIFYFPEEPAYLRECVGQGEDCHEQRMLETVYRNIRYPAIARENGVQGTVVAAMIIDETGRLEKTQILRSIGGGTDASTLSAIGHLSKEWVPAMVDGKPVASRIVLPVNYRLE
jgi:TonB family protein